MWQKPQSNKNRKFRSLSGLRYSSKDYNNPYFNRRKRKKRNWQLPSLNIGWKLKISLYIVLALFVFFLIWFFGTDFFLVNYFSIEGGGRISVVEIENTAKAQTNSQRWIIFPEKHILFYDTKELKIELEKKYAFDRIEIKKKLPSTIVLRYQEKSYALIWEEENNYFYSDNTGLILEEANLLEVGERDYPIIKNETGARTLGASILAGQDYINAAMDIFSQIKAYDDIQIERFLLDTEINNIKFKIVSGPLVLMNTEEDISKQINKLIIIKNEKIKDDFHSKEYIDVRYGDSVYYR